MATYPFWKLHGLGNDFVFFDAMEEELELSTAEVAALCDRHTGIGGDGVIVVKPSPRSECAGYMHYINADGSLAQMCGNGVRCFAKFLGRPRLRERGKRLVRSRYACWPEAHHVHGRRREQACDRNGRYGCPDS